MSVNPIQYTSRSFLTILNDINSNAELIDKPDWFKKLIAGVGDMLAMYEDAIANQGFLRTAFTRQAVADLLAQIDYELSSHTPSTGTELFYLLRTVAGSLPITIDKTDLVAVTSGGTVVSSLRFESRADETVASLFTETFTATAGTDKLTVARTGGYYLGDLIRVSSTTTLPAPLAASTDYYVVPISATEIKLATSRVLAFAGTIIDITDAGVGTHTLIVYSLPITVYQQESLSAPVVVGASDGTTSWQEFDLPNTYVIKATVAVTINSVSWTRVDSFVSSISTDKHFRLLAKSDGAFYLQFGNGTYGAIPGNFDVYADYAFGGGSITNISTLNVINLYAGSESNIEACTNTTTMTGGADEEDLDSAKTLAPILLKARDRFVTVEDGQALLLAYGGISRVAITKNFYGLLSCQIVCVPYGGGNLSAGLKATLIAYLQSKTILESIDIRFVDATYVPTAFTSAVKVLSGYTYADILDMYEMAVALLISEYTEEIVQKYQSQGIAVAVAYINTLWTYSFTDVDYTQIATLLDNVTAPDFGESLQLSKVNSLLSMVNGVDYVTITVPAAFPVTFASDEISQAGVITTTAI